MIPGRKGVCSICVGRYGYLPPLSRTRLWLRNILIPSREGCVVSLLVGMVIHRSPVAGSGSEISWFQGGKGVWSISYGRYGYPPLSRSRLWLRKRFQHCRTLNWLGASSKLHKNNLISLKQNSMSCIAENKIEICNYL